MNNKNNVFVWILYDFANSFVFITFLLFFSKWLVVSQGVADWQYNATFIIGSVGLLFFAPLFGARADKLGSARKYLNLSTVSCFVFYGLAIISAVVKAPLIWPLILFGLGNFFYQFSFVFYNPILYKVSGVANRGRISGLGCLGNYFGQISGLLLALLFVSGKITLPGIDPLLAALIPAVLIFFGLSLPLMLNKSLFVPTVGGEEKIVGQKALWRILRLIPGILPFMLAFFLFNDAVTTLTNNYSIVTSNLFHISNSQLSLVTLLVIVMAGFGGLGWGVISDKIGSKKALIFLLCSWVVFLPVLALAQKYQLYFIFSLAAGLSIGGTSTVSRQILTFLLPERILNYGFGIYAISERASTIFGPLAWTAVLSLSGYRAAIMSMVIFQIISVILISKLPKTKV